MITGRKGPMLSHFCAATPALFILWIIMAQVAGQEDREKTTALKGELLLIMITLMNNHLRRISKTEGNRLYFSEPN